MNGLNELNALYRRRIGIPERDRLSFEDLDRVLERAAYTFPFENLRIIARRTGELTADSLIRKLLVDQEGGLCYELNPALYLFMLENGFDVSLRRGVVFNEETQAYQTLGRTHVTILLNHEGRSYLVDTGFGGNLPLRPVPLTGETVSSGNGEFRIRESVSGPGDYILEVKLKHKDPDWRIGYAFDSRTPVDGFSELNDVQATIVGHPESHFNRKPLVTKLTPNGSVTLTASSFTRWEDGIASKEGIDETRYRELLARHFGL